MFVHLCTDAVPGAMNELVAIAILGKRRAGGTIDVAQSVSGPSGLERGLLGRDKARPCSSDVIGNRPGECAASGVAVEAIGDAPEVEQDHLVGLDHSIAGVMMRARRVRTGRHDDEDHRVVTRCQEPIMNVGLCLLYTSDAADE